MNLFQKYGIKEVADVVFYSMKEVGDEIVETPVLYLDTLKVSTLEKTASSAFAQGGLKNKKLIKWNFGKDIKLTLEDALFSPASMSMIWGGKLQSKLGTLTDIIAKINYANIYGKLRYSTKAYPSPSLTDDEWEIVFKILNKEIGEGYEYIVDNEIPSKMTEKNKNYWIKRYYSRPTELIDNDENIYTYDYDKKNGYTIEKESYLNIPETSGEKNDFIKNYYTDSNTGEKKIINPTIYANKAMPEYVVFNLRQLINELSDIGEIETSIGDTEVVDRMEKCIVKDRNGLEISTKKQLDNLFRYYSNDRSSSYTIYYDAKTMLPLLHVENDKIIKENYTRPIIRPDLFVVGTANFPAEFLQLGGYTEMNGDVAITDQIIYNKMVQALVTSPDVNDFEFVYNPDTQKYDCLSPVIGYTQHLSRAIGEYVYYNTYGTLNTDITRNNILHLSITSGVQLTGYFEGQDKFKIKHGTVYYKWTRTVKYKEDNDDGILGRVFTIDSDTFPADYKIVGETYIRNQKTLKDQRYQFTIYRANVSSDTSITLQAEGDPTTFSMSIDVLSPENDIQMELKQLDVEEDKWEGGTRIVPQKAKYSYTPAYIDYNIIVPDDNNEIY